MSFLGVIVETIIPNGKINGYIKGIFSLVLMFVIVSPLPKFFNKNLTIDTSYEYQLEEGFLEKMNSRKLENYKIAILKKLETKGLMGFDIRFDADVTNSDLKIKKVYIDATNFVLNDIDEHINISDTIVDTVLSIVDIDSREVYIDGV